MQGTEALESSNNGPTSAQERCEIEEFGRQLHYISVMERERTDKTKKGKNASWDRAKKTEEKVDRTAEDENE